MAAVPNLPTTRQRRHVRIAAEKNPANAQENLTRAFLTFTQAAGSLERSYGQLQAEVRRLHLELEQANRELEKSLEENTRVRGYLSRVLDNLPCGVLVADKAGQLQVANPEARKLLQIREDWNSGQDSGLPNQIAGFLQNAPANSFFSEQEWPQQTSAGNRVIGILRANISENSEGASDNIWIVRDITEEKKLAAEREAARRSHALAEVATILAHEIRNPLGSMELFTGLLADATEHMPETRQWMTHLQAGLRSLSATVNNVLQFHSQPAAQLAAIELDTLLSETLDFLQPLARQRGQSVRFENAIGKVATQADGNRLKQVFLNLALNAFRAMPPGGALTVRVGWAPQFPEGAVQVEFQDEGRGLPEELLDRIYEPGFTTTSGSPGLGLAVCKKVVEQHGGEIRVRSKPQHGATFSIVLPVAGAKA